MPDLVTSVFASIQQALPESAVTVTTKDGTVLACACEGIGHTRTNSDEGQSFAPTASLYIPQAHDTEGKLFFGGILKVSYQGRESDWRIDTVYNQAGLLRIELKALHG